MTTLTPADRALDLFRHREPVENPIDWLANQLIALAIECKHLTIRIVHAAGGEWTALELSDSAHVVKSMDPGPLRLFRTLLARFAKMAEEEHESAFSPYGGKIHFERPGPGGLVRIDVELENTTREQSLVAKAGIVPR